MTDLYRNLADLLTVDSVAVLREAAGPANLPLTLHSIARASIGHESIAGRLGADRLRQTVQNLSSAEPEATMFKDAALSLMIDCGRAFQAQSQSPEARLSPAQFLSGILLLQGEGEPDPTPADVRSVQRALVAAGITLEILLSPSKSASFIYAPLGYGEDMCGTASRQSECPVFGQDKLLGDIAVRLRHSSVCLIGEPGVGKSAVVRGLAWHIQNSSAFLTPSMRTWRIVAITRSDLLAGTNDRGGLEKRIKDLLDHVRMNPQVILFLDEVHSLLDTQDKNGSAIVNALKPAMADHRAPLRIISATTDREYERHVMPDEALNSRLAPTFVVPEASEEATVRILDALLPSLTPAGLRSHGGRVLEDGILPFIACLSGRYQRLDCQPRKSIRLLSSILQRKDYEVELGRHGSVTVDRPFVLRIARELWKVNVTREDPAFWKQFHAALLEVAPSQAEAARGIAAFFLRTSRRQRAPQPVGTPLARILVLHEGGRERLSLENLLSVIRRSLFDDERAGEHEDMREFSQTNCRTRFVGSPPGYVGHGETRTVLSKVRSRPQGGVLHLINANTANGEVIPDMLALLEGGGRDSAGRPVEASQWVMVLSVRIEAGKPGMDVYELARLAEMDERILNVMDLVFRLEHEAAPAGAPSFELLVNDWLKRGVALPDDRSSFQAEFEQWALTSDLPPDRFLDQYFQRFAETEVSPFIPHP